MIQIEGLTKKYGNGVAVDSLTLHISQGEFFAFLGANGAGKTTTIKMLTGLLKPTAGTAKICGHDIVEDYVRAKAKISYVPDQPFLYDKLSGREFLHFVGEMYGMTQDERETKIDELIRLFELRAYVDNLCETYSHGMRQRVVLSAALMHGPEVIITDEPLVALDPKSARILKDLLKRMAKNGAAVFMSTHTLAVAEEMADRIGIIHKGKLIALGTFEEIKEISRTSHRLEDAFLTLTADEEPAHD
ncbi:MAG: ABC transporter ATP-binding protein [Planctomycetes bacterium]|nr:ABC transporter ATP-binding protein [Planctomycetota bacterium]